MIIKSIKYILLPLSFLYGVIMDIRNLFYDWGIFKSYKFDVPIISVGNITAGGTGKTPFVIWLAKKLSRKYEKIAVISRGYGRDSKGLLEVSDYRNPRKFGDEPCLIAVSVPQAAVIVSENRKKAIDYALIKKNADLIILDDAFQHRSVRRDADIVLLNAKEKLKANFPIPSGRLREFRHNLKRGDMFILTHSEGGFSERAVLPDRPSFKSSGRITDALNRRFDTIGEINGFSGIKAAAFSAIAHPQNFKNYLKEKGIIVEKYFSFRDHYSYKAEDIRKIVKEARDSNCGVIFCTEKDMVKIAALQETAENENIPLYALRYEVDIEDEKNLLKKISDHIDKNTK